MYAEYSYTVEHHEHGILVRCEPFPMEALNGLVALAGVFGYDQLYPGIAEATGAQWAFTSTEAGAKWTAEIEARLAKRGLSPLQTWFKGTSVGISSQTLAHVLSEGEIPPPKFGPDVPSDAGDFERCLQLVRLMDGWRERLPEVADRYLAWANIVAHWDELAAWFDAREYEKIYALLSAVDWKDEGGDGG